MPIQLVEAFPPEGVRKFATRIGGVVNRASRRVAARVFQSQVKLLRKAESIAGAVGKFLNLGFNKLTAWLGGTAKRFVPDVAGHLAGQFWASVLGHVTTIMGGELGKVAEKAHNDALATVATELKPAIKAVAEPLTHKTAFDYLNTEFKRPDTTPAGMPRPHVKGKRIDSLLVTPLTAKEKERLVFASGWQNRIQAQTGLGSPREIAAIVSKGLRENKTVKEISRDLRGAVNNVRATANRIARHETMHLAHRANMAAWHKLGSLVVGYTVHSVMDARVRPAHRERNGRTYWRVPRSGQHGLGEMPNPPYEADGSIAHSCRCWITPVLALHPDNLPQPTGPLAADVMSAWFDRADPNYQRAAVGVTGHDIATRALGRKPQWSDFINADEQLLGTQELMRRMYGGVGKA